MSFTHNTLYVAVYCCCSCCLDCWWHGNVQFHFWSLEFRNFTKLFSSSKRASFLQITKRRQRHPTPLYSQSLTLSSSSSPSSLSLSLCAHNSNEEYVVQLLLNYMMRLKQEIKLNAEQRDTYARVNESWTEHCNCNILMEICNKTEDYAFKCNNWIVVTT